MNDVIAELKLTYIEEITKTVTPYIIFTSVFYLVCIVVWTHDRGLWNNLTSYNIFVLFDLSNGPIKEAFVKDILASLIGAILTKHSYQVSKKLYFNFVTNRIDLESRINEKIKESKQLKSENDAINLFIASELQKDKQNKIKNMDSNHSVGKVAITVFWASSLSCCFVLFVSAAQGKLLFCKADFFVSLASAIIVLYVQERNVIHFLKAIMPLIIVEKTLLGKTYELN
ncbi:MAG: hypothetical protein AAGF93_18540 [Cyanobacteria bacterium P01_H01_bin.105]